MYAQQSLTHPNPAVAYLRRSTDRQEQSIGDQRKAIDRYALEHGFEILHYYIDDAISGTSVEQRKAFLELIDDAKERECPFKFVLVYDVKRFGRLDNDEAGFYRFTLRKRGIEIVYISEGFNGDDTDDLLRPVKQWQARQESKDLSLVTIRGQLTRVHAGWWNGGVPPYGYDLAYFSGTGQFLMTVRYQPDGTKSILDADSQVTRRLPKGESLNFSKADRCKLVPSAPERVEVVQNIYTWYTRDGMGFKAVADRLNMQGIPSPRGGNWSSYHGKDWSMTTIRDILINPAYVGDMVWNRLTFAKFHRVSDGKAVPKRGIPKGGAEQNREEDWVIVPDAHPALISRAQFETAKTKRDERRQRIGINTFRMGHGAKSTYLLTGLIQCTHCGHYWQGYSTTKGRRRKDGTSVKNYYYACNGYVSKGNHVCERSVILQEDIEAWVLQQIEQIIQRYLVADGEAVLRAMIRREIEETVTQTEVQSTLSLEVILTRKQEITRQVSAALGNISEANRDFVNAHLEQLRCEMEDLTRQEESIRLQAGQQQRVDDAVEQACTQAYARIREVRKVLYACTIDEQRTIIRAFLRKITFDPKARTGMADFWLIPSAGNEDPRRNPAGRGRRTDIESIASLSSSDAQATPGSLERRVINLAN